MTIVFHFRGCANGSGWIGSSKILTPGGGFCFYVWHSAVEVFFNSDLDEITRD